MEKLQAALEQARKKRGAGGGRTNGLLTEGFVPSATQEAWDALAPMEQDEKSLQQQRIIAQAGGAQATSYDMLRTKVYQMMKSNGWRRLAITSPSPGSGKSTTAANLAVGLGRQVDQNIVLMEMDMRRPSLAKLFGCTGEYSVFDVLEQRVTFAQQARRLGKNLAVSINYHYARDPSELFLRSRTAEIIDGIEADYQPGIMLFDMPPMLANDDTRAFLGNVDCALIIAEAGVSTPKQIDLCERELAEQTNILGVVLNKCRFPDDAYGYGYKY